MIWKYTSLPLITFKKCYCFEISKKILILFYGLHGLREKILRPIGIEAKTEIEFIDESALRKTLHLTEEDKNSIRNIDKVKDSVIKKFSQD